MKYYDTTSTPGEIQARVKQAGIEFTAGYKIGAVSPDNNWTRKTCPKDWTDETWRGFRNARKHARFNRTIAAWRPQSMMAR